MLFILDSEKELENKDVSTILGKYIDNLENAEKARQELISYYADNSDEKAVDFDMVLESSTDLFEKSGKLYDNLLEVFSYYFSLNKLDEFFDIVGSMIMEAKLKEIEFQQKDNIINNLEEKNARQARFLDEKQYAIEKLSDDIFKLKGEVEDAEKNEDVQKEGERLRKIFNIIINKIGGIGYATIDQYLETEAFDDFEKNLDRSLEYYESRLANQDKDKLGYLKVRNEIRDLLKDPSLANDYKFLESVKYYIDELITDLTKEAAISEANQKVLEVAEIWKKAMANGGKDVVASSGHRDEHIENLLDDVQDLVTQYKEDIKNEG